MYVEILCKVLKQDNSIEDDNTFFIKLGTFCPMLGTFCPNTFCLCAVLFVQALFVLQSNWHSGDEYQSLH